ncbi:MAG: TonB-dependent receptor [Bacteroidales bacterium]|nr:TonB-dependent receptor [Bacteroidales bacterium]
MKWMSTLAVIFCLLYGRVSEAQSLKQTIRGRIVDIDSKAPLIGVTLFIEGSDPIIGTITDNEGIFSFKALPIGRYNIGVSYIGYETKLIPNVLLGAGKEVILNLELTESVQQLEEVVITARKNKGEAINDMAIVSARSITVEETRRFAGSLNDPSRLVSSYAGVMGDPDGNNDIIIRGNSPRGMQWRLEGVDVPNPNHFANEGATGGPISILNNSTLDNCDFFTGAFPADYGESYSGVFDIHLRKGNDKKHEFTAQLGIIGSDLTAEGPFTKENSASYLVNYRYSSLDLLNRTGIKVAGDAVPKFQDLTFNLYVPTARFGTFQLFGIGGLSTIFFDETDWKQDFAANMGIMGFNHILPLNSKTYLKSSLSFSGSTNNWKYFEFENEKSEPWIQKGYDDFIYTTYTASTTLSHKFSAKHTLKLGITGKILAYNLVMDDFDWDENVLYRTLDDQGNSTLVQGFVNWKYRPVESLTFNTGMHAKYLDLNGNYAVEPRLGMRWQFTDRQAITAGFGLHSRTDNISLYLLRERLEDGSLAQNNKGLDFLHARHYVAGYEFRVSQNLNFKMEGYYQELYNVPVDKDPNSTYSILNQSDGYIIRDLVNEGTGTTYGAELSLDKYFAQRYYFLITGSVFESKYAPLNGVEYNTRFNNNYIFNVVGGKEFPVGKTKNSSINVNVRGSYAGGQWYTPIDQEESVIKGYTVRDESQTFGKKREDYMRMDLKISFRRNKKKSTRTWELDIQNVSNALNVTGDYWNETEQKIETWTQLGLLPTINYRIEF